MREYRWAQRKFWDKYGARLVPRLPKVWDTCGELAKGVGAGRRHDGFRSISRVDVS